MSPGFFIYCLILLGIQTTKNTKYNSFIDYLLVSNPGTLFFQFTLGTPIPRSTNCFTRAYFAGVLL